MAKIPTAAMLAIVAEVQVTHLREAIDELAVNVDTIAKETANHKQPKAINVNDLRFVATAASLVVSSSKTMLGHSAYRIETIANDFKAALIDRVEDIARNRPDFYGIDANASLPEKLQEVAWAAYRLEVIDQARDFNAADSEDSMWITAIERIAFELVDAAADASDEADAVEELAREIAREWATREYQPSTNVPAEV